MHVSEFVAAIAKKVGNEGAIVLVALERDIDILIQRSLGLSCYHPGKPSPWSHTFLIAGPFDGPMTPILDCTIRDKKDQIAWKLDLISSIKAVFNKAGKIYTATPVITTMIGSIRPE